MDLGPHRIGRQLGFDGHELGVRATVLVDEFEAAVPVAGDHVPAFRAVAAGGDRRDDRDGEKECVACVETLVGGEYDRGGQRADGRPRQDPAPG